VVLEVVAWMCRLLLISDSDTVLGLEAVSSVKLPSSDRTVIPRQSTKNMVPALCEDSLCWVAPVALKWRHKRSRITPRWTLRVHTILPREKAFWGRRKTTPGACRRVQRSGAHGAKSQLTIMPKAMQIQVDELASRWHARVEVTLVVFKNSQIQNMFHFPARRLQCMMRSS
jgi:hypothetical protein